MVKRLGPGPKSGVSISIWWTVSVLCYPLMPINLSIGDEIKRSLNAISIENARVTRNKNIIFAACPIDDDDEEASSSFPIGYSGDICHSHQLWSTLIADPKWDDHRIS